MRTLPCFGTSLLCLVLFARCCPDVAAPADNYFPLTPGSYWIYEWYEVQQNGSEALFGKVDTVRITGDTIINDRVYAIEDYMDLGKHHTRYMRDSSGYLVDLKGRSYFSTDDTADTLYISSAQHLTAQSYFIMDDGMYDITVPAGDFETRLVRGYSTLELAQHPSDPRYVDSHYAKNVGNVLHTAFYSSATSTLEARLVAYHIE